MQRKNMWKEYTEIQQKELEELSVRYKECLDIGKTERECVKIGKKMADTWGYKNLEDCISEGTTLKAGDKVYADCMGKAFVMFQLGKKPLEEGMNILGAHIDSPRIDVKQNPLYDIWIHITMAESRNISGLRFRLQFMERLQKKTEQCGTLLLGKRKMIRYL